MFYPWLEGLGQGGNRKKVLLVATKEEAPPSMTPNPMSTTGALPSRVVTAEDTPAQNDLACLQILLQLQSENRHPPKDLRHRCVSALGALGGFALSSIHPRASRGRNEVELDLVAVELDALSNL